MPIEWCCDQRDAFDIFAEVKGNTISHRIRISSPALRGGVNVPEPWHLSDFTIPGGKFDCGNAGLFVPENCRMKVEFWYLPAKESKNKP